MAATAVQSSFVCVECGMKSEEIYKEFKGGSFKLCICKFCQQRVDKYVEFDTVLVFLDVILHKIQAYRHLVFNKPPKIYWQLGIIFLLCDSYLFNLSEAIIFVFGILVALRSYMYWSKASTVPNLQDILRVLLLSSFGKLLAFPAVVWGQTHSAVYLGMTRLFIFTSNVVAFKVLFGKTSPALFIIIAGNLLLYFFILVYRMIHLQEYIFAYLVT